MQTPQHFINPDPLQTNLSARAGLARRPVQGFSAVLPGQHEGTYLVMSDNGFGNKANSADALLRVYTVKPDFKTGTVTPVNRFTGDELA